jgi:hypothetical protein
MADIVMTTLEYYSADGTHTVFEDYTIDKKGVVVNVKMEKVMSRRENAEQYNLWPYMENRVRNYRVGGGDTKNFWNTRFFSFLYFGNIVLPLGSHFTGWDNHSPRYGLMKLFIM